MQASFLLLYTLCLYRVEPFSVNTSGWRLGDKCLRVDTLDEAEDINGFRLADEYQQNFDWLLRIAAVSVKYRAAAIHIVDYPINNLFILLRDDEELHRLAIAVYDLVDHIIADNHLDKGEHNLRYIVEKEV